MGFKGDLEALILGVLNEGESHGYQIAKRIRQKSDRALDVGEGQLYPALHVLEAAGHLCSEWIPQDGKPPRKVYKITSAGHKALETKRDEWQAFADGVRAILTTPVPPKEAF